jgi:anti-anti-sigma factor
VTTHVNVQIESYSATACIVVLRGEHDLTTADAVATVMQLASAYRDVLVDLESCTFADSSLINTLLQAARHARERGGALELVLAPGRDPVRRTFEIAQIDALLVFHPTRAAGAASLATREHPTHPPPRGRQLKARIEDIELDTDSKQRSQHRGREA